MSTGSGSGAGADQHLLALLRAIRLRQAAPDAVAAGIADTAAALTHLDEINRRRGLETEHPGDHQPDALPGSGHTALPPGPSRPGLPPGPEHDLDEPGAATPRPGWANPADQAHLVGGDFDERSGRVADEVTGAQAAGFFERGRANRPADSGPGEPATGPSAAGPAADLTARPHTSGRPRAGGGFFASGPLMRPAALQPIDPTKSGRDQPGPPAVPTTGQPETRAADQPGQKAGADQAGPKTGADQPGQKAGADQAGRANQAANRAGADDGGAARPRPVSGAGPTGDGQSHGLTPAERDDGFGQGTGRPSRNRFAGLSPQRAQPHPISPAPVPYIEDNDPAAARPGWADGDGDQSRAAPRVPGNEGHAHIAPPMVAAAPGRASAVDGMDPADDALLRETQRLLSTSLTFAGGPVEVAERFRTALLRAHPGMMEKLPGDERTQTDLLAGGLTWLVHNLDQPPQMVSGCGRLGAALAACGVRSAQLQLVGAALAESMRAGMPAGTWRQDFDLAWRSTWQHVYEWIRHGEATAGHQPAIWTAVVESHELRRPDLAVIRLRPMLPMPFRPGQFARVEVAERPGIWRPYSLAGAPRRDNIVELHVRAKTRNGVSGTLVFRTKPGDRVRLSRAEGEMQLPEQPGRDLLMIAGDTGVAPLKALLTELRDTGDSRSAVLFWGVRNLAELYDIEELTAIARAAKRATVIPVISEGDPGRYASGLVTDAVAAYGEWSRHEVYLAGPPLMLAATSVALHALGVSPDAIHHDAPE